MSRSIGYRKWFCDISPALNTLPAHSPLFNKSTNFQVSISRIVNGRFVEEVVTTDLLSLMNQLSPDAESGGG